MAKQRGRESSVGIIVTLVFFILISIGLGVATYYGFAQQADLTAQKNAAVAAQADSDKERDWYRFQALTYRTYLGQTTNIDDVTLKVAREGFDSQAIGKNSKGDFKDRADVAALIAAVESKKYKIAREDPKTKAIDLVTVSMVWDNMQKRPKVNYEDIYKGQTGLGDYYEQQVTKAAAAKEDAQKAAQKSDEEKVAFKKTYDLEIAAANKKINDTQKKADDDNAKARDDLLAAQKATADAVQAGEDKVKTEHKLLAGKEQKIKELEAKLGDLNYRLDQLAKKDLETPANGKAIPTDWKIVQMDKSGKYPFINLGLADNVRPPLTFSIHGRGPDGKPLAASKGTLEVINVVNDHLAQTQVVSVKDSAKDPILPGDYLYNPVFHPGSEQHVVIAGRVDMHGTKQDDLDEFQRLLKRQSVAVDGYVDPADGTVKGKLTVGTDYLVLGNIEEAKDATMVSIKQLQEQARNNGVRIISVREFLDSMGYRTP